MSIETVPLAASRTARLAAAGVAASLTAAAFILAVSIVFLARGSVGEMLFGLLPVLLILDTSLVGGLLATRRPDNVIGALLLVTGVLSAVSFAANYYVRLDDLLGRGPMPFLVPFAWVGLNEVLAQTLAPTSSYLWLRGDPEMGL